MNYLIVKVIGIYFLALVLCSMTDLVLKHVVFRVFLTLVFTSGHGKAEPEDLSTDWSTLCDEIITFVYNPVKLQTYSLFLVCPYMKSPVSVHAFAN